MIARGGQNIGTFSVQQVVNNVAKCEILKR